MTKPLRYLSLFLLILSACSPAVTATPLLPSPPTATEQIFLPRPTETLTPTPIPSATPSPTPINATQQAAQALCGAGLSTPPPADQALSPDGQWGTVICDGSAASITKVYRLADGRDLWDLPAYSLPGADGPTPAALIPFHWSDNGKYLYLVARLPGADPVDLQFEDGRALVRLDLSDGHLSRVLDPYPGDGYALSFSPADRYLSYVAPGEITLIHMVDLSSGYDNVIHLKAQYWDAGFFSWSPSGRQFVFTAAMPDWATHEGGFSILSYDVLMHKLLVLVENDSRQLATTSPSWLSDTEVPLYSALTGEHMKLNVTTREITPYRQ